MRAALALLILLTLAAVRDATADESGRPLVNVQVLTGMSRKELMKEMQAWNKALGVRCTKCHQSMAKAELDDTREKKWSREMARLVKSLNAELGPGKMSCYSCHRGALTPLLQPLE